MSATFGGVSFALAAVLLIISPAIIVDDWAAAGAELRQVSEGFRASADVVLGFIGSSVLVLRITYALVDRRELNLDEHADAEARFTDVAALCCLLAVPFFVLALPSALSEPAGVGEAVGLLVLTLLSFVFAFAIGSSWAPNAREQLSAVERSYQRVAERCRSPRTQGLPKPARAAATLFAVIVLSIFVPPALALRAVRAELDPQVALSTFGVFAAIGLVSWYGIFLSHFGRYIAHGMRRALLIAVGSVFAVGGWVPLVALAVTFRGVDSTGYWSAAEPLFLVGGIAFGALALLPAGKWATHPAVALWSILAAGDRWMLRGAQKRARLLQDRISDYLQTSILAAPTGSDPPYRPDNVSGGG